MNPIEETLAIRTPEAFERAALELFRVQSERCAPYREYLDLIGVDGSRVDALSKIPFLPIELFKSHTVYCGSGEPEIVFTSSTTGGGEPSRHPMERLSDYDKTYRAAFAYFYGAPSGYTLFALLPGYLERGGSSLVRMAAGLIAAGGGGFYLDEYERLMADLEAAPGKKIVLGVSYALWDLAEKHAPKLRDTIVMETGGMKGRREELPKSEFHAMLCEAFGVERVHSEYGMAELSSQAYSGGGGIFRTPPWMRVLVRDPNDPFDVSGNPNDPFDVSGNPNDAFDVTGGPNDPFDTGVVTGVAAGTVTGGLNVIDLANVSSCAFIQTQDLGRVHPDGSFEVLGRADRSEIRGCNLLIQREFDELQ